MFAERLIEKRSEKGLSQEQLGEQVGVTQQFISLLEKGFKAPAASVVVRLADALECSTDYLLGRI